MCSLNICGNKEWLSHLPYFFKMCFKGICFEMIQQVFKMTFRECLFKFLFKLIGKNGLVFKRLPLILRRHYWLLLSCGLMPSERKYAPCVFYTVSGIDWGVLISLLGSVTSIIFSPWNYCDCWLRYFMRSAWQRVRLLKPLPLPSLLSPPLPSL